MIQSKYPDSWVWNGIPESAQAMHFESMRQLGATVAWSIQDRLIQVIDSNTGERIVCVDHPAQCRKRGDA